MRNKHVCFFGGRGAIVLGLFFGGTEFQLQKYKLVQLMTSKITSNPTQHSKMGNKEGIHLEVTNIQPTQTFGKLVEIPYTQYIWWKSPTHPGRELNNRSVRRLIPPQHRPLGPRATAAPTPKSGDLKLGKQQKHIKTSHGGDVGHSWNGWGGGDFSSCWGPKIPITKQGFPELKVG